VGKLGDVPVHLTDLPPFETDKGVIGDDDLPEAVDWENKGAVTPVKGNHHLISSLPPPITSN